MIEVNIMLDPVADGITQMPVKTMMKDRMCLVMGTNGDYRVITEKEACEILDSLGKDCEFDLINNTPYIMAFNKKKVINIEGSKLLIGSSLIARCDRELFLMSEEDIEDAKNKFISKLIKIKLGPDQIVPAYEIC